MDSLDSIDEIYNTVTSSDHKIAALASGRSITLLRNNTLAIDAIGELAHDPDLHVFSADYDVYALPKHHMPRNGIPAPVVYQGITDLRQLDHNPRLNLASFVTTWMEDEAVKLITDSLNVNLVDLDEYPSCTDVHQRCVSMLADLYHSPSREGTAVGAGTIGSSEAIMLAGLAMKKNWQARRRASNLSTDKPNLVMSYSVQGCCAGHNPEAKPGLHRARCHGCSGSVAGGAAGCSTLLLLLPVPPLLPGPLLLHVLLQGLRMAPYSYRSISTKWHQHSSGTSAVKRVSCSVWVTLQDVTFPMLPLPLLLLCAPQVCWEKFCRYFDVEEKYVPLEEGRYSITPELARAQIDENTIGVVGILGSTYNGEFEDIQGLNSMVEEVNNATGWCVPIHVDAASGGFIAPFLYPDLLWDFKLESVKSINVSGHKYGLVYAGIGWVVWREPSDVPEDLVFHINYLGTDQASITLNFSRGASHVLAQYYQLLRLGRAGYSRIMSNLDTIAKRLADGILATGEFELLSKPVGVPLVAFRLKKKTLPDGSEVERGYDEYDVSDRLKEHGWVLPAYTMAPNARHVKLLRAVVRVDHSMTLVEKLIGHIHEAVKVLHIQEATNAQRYMKAVREQMQPHRSPANPHRIVKTTSQC